MRYNGRYSYFRGRCACCCDAIQVMVDNVKIFDTPDAGMHPPCEDLLAKTYRLL
jgi:hypothetical protein